MQPTVAGLDAVALDGFDRLICGNVMPYCAIQRSEILSLVVSKLFDLHSSKLHSCPRTRPVSGVTELATATDGESKKWRLMCTN